MKFSVRPYQPSDRKVLRQIAYDTALMGRSADVFFEGEEFLKDALTLYFTDHEPQSAWVAEVDGVIAGYIIAARDESRMGKCFLVNILPGLLVDVFRSGMLFKPVNFKLLKGLVAGWLSGELQSPDLSAEYPGVLHINIKDGMRGSGVGTALMNTLINVFRQNGVKGVRLATMSEKGASFFRKNGFTLLFEGKRSYFNEVAGGKVPLYIFGRKMNP